MKYYLSSFQLGNETETLKRWIQEGSRKFAYIPNARDFTTADPVRRKESTQENMEDLRALGAEVEELDLRNYFGKKAELKAKLDDLQGLYISGGNSFILRQAMKLSGLDELIIEMSNRSDFVYAGYSAAVCVLAPTLKAYAITDDATDMPYPELQQPIWDGLGILDYVVEPHYDSDHPESASTDKEIKYCVDNKILFKAYRDGEVLIIE